MALQVGIIGGRRGGSFTHTLEHLKDRLQLAAVCDTAPEVCKRWKDEQSNLRTYATLDEMLNDDKLDAVVIATPMQLHAEHSIKTLRAGKHVLSEVAACITHEEAIALIAAVEETGMTYMMAENYCYRRDHMMVLNMVQQGVFGELTYAEGMYIHAVFGLHFHPDGSSTWRSNLRRTMPSGNRYPTHSFGPIAQWMGIGSTDHMKSLYSLSTGTPARERLYAHVRGAEDPAAQPGYWGTGDSCSSLIQTEQGRVIYLRFDTDSYRPHDMHAHELQGTTACFRTQNAAGVEPLFWVDGESPAADSRTLENGQIVPGVPTKWQNMSDLREKFDHPYWREFGELAQKAGHGGGDFFTLRDFVNAIDGSAPNPVDVYTAVTWSSIIWLSQQSEAQNQPVEAIRYAPQNASV